MHLKHAQRLTTTSLLYLSACSLFSNSPASDKSVFRTYLSMEPSAAIDSLHTFTDFLGIDYKVLIAFRCDSLTIKKIAQKNDLALSKEVDNGLGFMDNLSWWNKQVMMTHRPYKKKMPGRDEMVPDGDRQYLWYDAETKHAYYEQFSL